jgi:hypothetical protein
MLHYHTVAKVPEEVRVGVAVSYLRNTAQTYWFGMIDQIKAAGEDPDTWMVLGIAESASTWCKDLAPLILNSLHAMNSNT